MEKNNSNIPCIILAGGKNKRMNGNTKLLLEYEGSTFLDRIVSVLPSKDIYLSVNNKEKFSGLGYKIIMDEYEDIGPIGGILTAFHYTNSSALFVTACDMPFLSETTVRLLFDKHNETGLSTFAQVNDDLQPLLGIYTNDAIPLLEKAVSDGIYRPRFVIKQLEAKYGIGRINLLENDKSAVNINTADEYNLLISKRK